MPPATSPQRAPGRRPVLVAAAVYAVLSLLFVAPALVPGHTLSASDYLWSGPPFTAAKPADVKGLGSNYEEADASLQFQPFMQWTRGQLPDIPLWNPHQAAGRPFVANMQSALFSPFSWPAYVFGFWWSLGLIGALKLFCGAFGAHLLARSLGMRRGAYMAGITYGFGLYFVSWLSWPLATVWAWLPLLLLAVRATVHRPGPRPVAALALVVALQFFGGHPESSFHVLAAASLFALLELSRAQGRGRALGRLVLGLGAGTALAAIALAPFLELLAHSADIANRADKTGGRLPPSRLLGYALPDYWGRATSTQTEGFSSTRAFYAGALPLMLALWAVVSRPSRERVWIAALGAGSMAVVVGVPGIFDLVNALPGFSHAYNTRLVIVGLLAIALLAGWGLDDLVEGPRRGRLLLAGAAVLLVLPAGFVAARVHVDGHALGRAFAVAWTWADATAQEAPVVLPLAALLVWLPIAGLAVLLLWARVSGRLAAGAFAALALALTAADEFRAGMGVNPAIPTANAQQPVTPALARLQADRPARFAGLQQPIGLQALAPNLAMRYGLYDARNYDYPVERRYDALWRADIAARGDSFTPPTMLVDTTDGALRALGLLGVKDILAPPQNPPVAGLATTYSGPDARIYANPHALPRAWVVAGQRVVGAEDAQRAAVVAPGFDARREAVVGRAVAGIAPRPAPAGGSAAIARYGPDRVELTATAPGRALVVLSDVWFEGWHATVDGRDAPIERVDYLLRGVAVGPGAHRIVMTYAPASWRAGWIVSLLTAAALLAAVLWKGPRRWPARSSER